MQNLFYNPSVASDLYDKLIFSIKNQYLELCSQNFNKLLKTNTLYAGQLTD